MITAYLISGMVGIMLFFTIIVAPTAFKVLPVEWSSTYVRNFFPKYYACWGLITAAAIFTAPDGTSKVLLAICTLLFAFTLSYLTRKINEAKDQGQNRRFQLLHGASVVINLFQLITFIYLLVKLSWSYATLPLWGYSYLHLWDLLVPSPIKINKSAQVTWKAALSNKCKYIKRSKIFQRNTFDHFVNVPLNNWWAIWAPHN